MICSSPRIEFGINLQGSNYDGITENQINRFAQRHNKKPWSLTIWDRAPWTNKGVFFLLLLLHEYLRESSRILRVYKMLWLVFFLCHIAIISAIMFPILYCAFIGMQIQNPSIPTTILCGILLLCLMHLCFIDCK